MDRQCAIAAARELLQLVQHSGRADDSRIAYGPGLFYLMGQSVDELIESGTKNLVYLPANTCEQDLFGAQVLSALAAEEATVVVLDLYEPGTEQGWRVVHSNCREEPHCQELSDMQRIKLDSQPLQTPHTIKQLLFRMAFRSARMPSPGVRALIFYDLQTNYELLDEQSPIDFELITEREFDAEIERLAIDARDRLRELWSGMDVQHEVLFWISNRGLSVNEILRVKRNTPVASIKT